MQAGTRRHYVVIQQNRPTRGPDGGPVDNWVTLLSCYAGGGPLRGQELWFAQEAIAEVTHRYEVPYGSELADLTGPVRLVFGARVFHVLDSQNVGERNRAIQLDCAEAADKAAPVYPPDFYGFG